MEYTNEYKYDVFISYSRKDYVDENKEVLPENPISAIKEAFDNNDITYWFDEEGIYSGHEFDGLIAKAIRESRLFLFISSIHSNASKWTSREIATADIFGKTIIPYRIDTSDYNDNVIMRISSIDYIDAATHEELALSKLTRAVLFHKSRLSLGTTIDDESVLGQVPNNPASDNINDFNITISDKRTPIVMFVGPPKCGKTSTILRLTKHLNKNGFTIEPDMTFRNDELYEMACSSFMSMASRNQIPPATSVQDSILLQIKNRGFKFFQMMDTPGSFYTQNHNTNEFTLQFYNVLISPNPIIWIFMIEPTPNHYSQEYIKRIKFILSNRPKSDISILLLNKIDQTDLASSQKTANEKKLRLFISEKQPEIIDIFANKTIGISRIKPLKCTILPFQTGVYEHNYVFPADEKYVQELWSLLVQYLMANLPKNVLTQLLNKIRPF